MKSEDYFNAFFSKKEWLTITEVGPSDYRGDAMVMLSNGDRCLWRSPVKGQKAGVLIHKPGIEPLQERAAWKITPWREEPVEITAEQLRKLLK